jgi:tRNA A-37 threonylcarbamoyl transferase component Bud32
VSVAELRRVGAARFRAWAGLPPIWILVVAGSFCAYFALLVYCDLFRPKNPGFEADPTPTGALVVTRIHEATPASRGGMAVGDRLIAVNGVTIIDSDAWGALGANYQIDVAMPVIVERNGQRAYLSMLLPPETFDYWRTRPGATLIVCRLAQLVTLLAGLFIAWRRPRDLTALAAAWFLLTSVVFTIALPSRLAIVWRGFPILIRELLWIPYASGLTVGPILLTFVTLFPRRLPYAGYVLAGTWAVACAAVAGPLYHAMQLVYRAAELRTVGPRSLPLLIVISLSLVASVALSVANYRRITDLNERRRLRVVVVGIAIGVLPGFSTIVYFWLPKHTNQAVSIFESPGMALAVVALLAAPLSITYAVLRHRLFDVSFIVRIGLQYALARWSVLSLVPAISVFMILETLRLHDQTVDTVLERRGLLYLTLTAVALVIFRYRRPWLKAIDRRFFRERHYSYIVLKEVAEKVRRAGSLDRVAPEVVAKIEESAMHPEFAALLVRDASARVFRTITAAPSASAPPDLPEDSKLVALARVVEQPLDTSEDGDDSVLRQIPAADLEFVRRAGIDILIPVITPDDQLHAFLALGPKRSQEPYSQEDYAVLVAIAENLALLVARSAPRRETPTLEECPECGTCFDAGTGVCRSHDRALASRGLPRTLAGRYRLDRRLAAGGMGTVYEALDIALERNVAAKVVRENLAASDGALSRFVEEAKLAARLREHPNVVTVYDFGVIDGRQPFMIMELLVGRTLRHELGTPGGLSPLSTYSILEGVCSAVSAAHRRGLVHRDLKPENIFLAEIEGGTVPKVLDFGIAKPVSVVTTMTYRRDTDPMVLLGTLEYMSPEQRRGEAPSVAWDLWSLAVIALEMLSDRPPASAFLPDVAPWQPGAVLKDTLPTCVEVFNRALSLYHAERPKDADALLLELTRALEDGRILPAKRGKPS